MRGKPPLHSQDFFKNIFIKVCYWAKAKWYEHWSDVWWFRDLPTSVSFFLSNNIKNIKVSVGGFEPAAPTHMGIDSLRPSALGHWNFHKKLKTK